MIGYRPLRDFKAAQSTKESLIKSLGDSQRLKPPSEIENDPNDITLTTWIAGIKRALGNRGLDTVFRIFDPATVTEQYMLENWGLVAEDDVAWWVDCLANTGVFETEAGALTNRPHAYAAAPLPAPQPLPVYPYDQYDLRMSALFLQDSLTAGHWNSIEKELPPKPTWPHIFVKVIQAHQNVNASAVRILVKQLEALEINKEPGENVLTFGDKIMDHVRCIQGTGQAPPDLNVIVATWFLKSSTLEFNVTASNLHDAMDTRGANHTALHIINTNKIKYRSLIAQGLWDSEAKATEIEGLKAEVSAYKAELDTQGKLPQ